MGIHNPSLPVQRSHHPKGPGNVQKACQPTQPNNFESLEQPWVNSIQQQSLVTGGFVFWFKLPQWVWPQRLWLCRHTICKKIIEKMFRSPAPSSSTSSVKVKVSPHLGPWPSFISWAAEQLPRISLRPLDSCFPWHLQTSHSRDFASVT